MNNPQLISAGVPLEIIFNDKFYSIFPDFDKQKKTLNVLEGHRDAVISIPDKAVLLASSKWTQNELYAIGDRVLSFQGHPELSTFAVQILTENLYEEANVISKQTSQHTLRSIE